MPATRKSRGTPQSSVSASSSLDDIPSMRMRKEIEILCKKWDVSIPQLIGFFGGIDSLTSRFLSSLRDLRVRTSWPLAKTLLVQSRTKAGSWEVQDVKAAIALADFDRDSNAQVATRSSRSTSGQTPQTPGANTGRADGLDDIYEMPDDRDDSQSLPRRRASSRRHLPNLRSLFSGNDDDDEQETNARSPVKGRLVDNPVTPPRSQPSSKSRPKRSSEDIDPEYPPPKRSAPTTRSERMTRRSLNKEESSPMLDSSPLSSVDSEDIDLEEVPDLDLDTTVPQVDANDGKRSIQWPCSFSRTLAPGEWLNDDAIYGLLSIFAACSMVEGRPTTAIVEPLLVTASRTTPARSLQRLLSDSQPDILILPVHLQNHWVLIVVRLSDHHAELLDSMPSKANRTKAGQIFSRFASLYLQLPDTVSITEVPSAEQDNDYDCGVFTVVNAIHTLIGRPPPVTISPDPWRKVFTLLSDKLSPPSQAFVEYLEMPSLDDVPTTQHVGGRDVDTFHELRKTWSSHFERRVAYLSGRIAQIKELEDIGLILEYLVKTPAQIEADCASPGDAPSQIVDVESESRIEKEIQNCERQIELRIELSHLPGCEFENDNLAPLRDKVARLKWRMGNIRTRREALRRLLSVIEVLAAFKQEAKLPLATFSGWLTEYRDLYIGTIAAEG